MNTTKQIAESIRAKAKEIGLSKKQVSVTRRSGVCNSSVHVILKEFVTFEQYEALKKLTKDLESADWDRHTGEILSGGNTFVFLSYGFTMEREEAAKFEPLLLSVETGKTFAVIPGLKLLRTGRDCFVLIPEAAGEGHKAFEYYGRRMTTNCAALAAAHIQHDYYQEQVKQ